MIFAVKKISYKNGCRISESIKESEIKGFRFKRKIFFWIRESQKTYNSIHGHGRKPDSPWSKWPWTE